MHCPPWEYASLSSRAAVVALGWGMPKAAAHAPRHPELLAPAGNWDCARAAVAAGADAIYFGLSRFNARLRADNFIDADLAELMEFLHGHGVKGLVTMNTLVFTRELEAAEGQLRRIAAAGVDALIVQDLGLAKLARSVAPQVDLHASTQMTISSPEGLAFVESLFPLDRAILARELSVTEIARFPSTSSSTPLEVFVHGALCVAYSGQCLTSESLGQRSANRGECAQACRMPYQLVVDGETRDLGEQRYLLSPQDLAAVDLIPGLLRAGVMSFKIEGRLKSPEYVTAVTRVYRKALDAAQAQAASPVTAADRYALEMTFSRGLSTGWLGGTNHPYLTHGRFGKKRGPLLGTIAACGPGWIELTETTGVPVAAGDGVVFDAGENRDLEQGARVWKIHGGRLIFHRSYSGIHFERIRPGHTVYKTSDPKLESELRRFWQNSRPPEIQFPLHLVASGRPGTPLVVTARIANGADGADDSGEVATAASALALQSAAKHPLDSATLSAQLGRLGDTPYQLGSLDNRLEGACHLPLSALNALRRDLVAQLTAATPRHPAPARLPAASTISYRDLLPASARADEHGNALPAVRRAAELSVLCRSLDQLAAAVACDVATIYCDFEDPRRYAEAVAYVRATPAPQLQRPADIWLATPRILKPGETGLLKQIANARPDGVLLRNLAALEYYKHSSLVGKKAGDFSLNIANPISAQLLMDHAGLDYVTVSYDLNVSQVLDLLQAAPPAWFELTLHQHMPMFHMEHCVFCAFMSEGTSSKDCGRPCDHHVVHLRDRVGQLHRLHADVGCRNTLFNAKAQTGARFFPALREAGLARFRVELLDEDPAAATSTIRAYQNLLAGTSDAAHILNEVQALEKLGVTEGTLGEK